MNSHKEIISKNIFAALKNPLIAVKLVWRRLFPFGIVPKDPEAYRIGSWSYGNIKRVSLIEIFPGIENADVKILKAYDRDMTTSVDISEITAIASIVKFMGRKNILEIGTFNGNTTLNLAANSSENTTITTVDLPENWIGKYEIEIPDIYKNVTERNSIGAHYKKFPEFSNKITQIFCDSARLEWDKMQTPFDFIFIDGNHHYNYVLNDTKNALLHLSKGGIIIWHDYGMIEDVSKVVDDFSSQMKIFALRGTRLAIGLKE